MSGDSEESAVFVLFEDCVPEQNSSKGHRVVIAVVDKLFDKRKVQFR